MKYKELKEQFKRLHENGEYYAFEPGWTYEYYNQPISYTLITVTEYGFVYVDFCTQTLDELGYAEFVTKNFKTIRSAINYVLKLINNCNVK